ncbi:choline dehydrogenase [Massilia sp. UMI-21]|nr:choline dehydrogenase [Massilia sp. UMI-21]
MYDYVIVGAGSAGCVLANRISANPDLSVCLLEAGPPDTHPLIRMPLGMVHMMMSKRLNWRYYSVPQRHLDGRRLYYPRGKTLGGSSASNAMVYTRGHASDYDHWAELGNRGWSYADVLPLFKRAEHHEAGPSPFHGVDGPLNVATQRSTNLLTRVFVEAAVEAGYARNPDFNGPIQEGVNCYELTQKHGERWSVARAYLHPALQRKNLTVLTGAHATRIRLEGQRAAGVDYLHRGRVRSAAARREVLVAAGAINSPQLLLLSGIGPEDGVLGHAIPVRHHLPGVGRNLQDHLDALVVHRCTRPVSLGISPATLPAWLKHLFDYAVHRRGPLTSNSAEGGGFLRSSPGAAIPDLQLHFTPAHLDGHARDLRSAAFTMLGHGYALHVCALRAQSRGRVSLHSADPTDAPLIDPRFLSDPADLVPLVAGVKAARAVLAAPAFDLYRGEEIFPGPGVRTDDDIVRFIRRKAESIYHPAGTCRMGHDPMAVVDDTLRVHGIAGLRVADASIMPTLVGGNTNAAVVMIGEKAADLVLAEAGARMFTPAGPAAANQPR